MAGRYIAQDQLVEIQDRAETHERRPAKRLPLTDHRNSVVGMWSGQDAELQTIFDYTPHGRLTVRNDREEIECRERGNAEEVCTPYDTPFLFGSMFRSEVTGLSYMRNRWYSPRLRQFLSPDPAGYVDSYNPYVYVAFDPINGWDPYGLKSQGPADREGANRSLPGRPGTQPLHQTDRSPSEKPGNEMMEGAAKEAVNGNVTLVNLYLQGQLGPICAALGCDFQIPLPFSINNEYERVGANMFTAIEFGLAGLGGVKAVGKGAARGVDEVGRAGDDVGRKADEACSNGRCDGDGVPCFERGTDVRLCDGTTEDIEDVEVGDRVPARNAETEETTCRAVRETMVTPNTRTLTLRLETSDGEGQTLDVTGDHPFWTRGGGWTNASDLEPGDRVYTSSGAEVRVVDWSWRDGRRTVYNLEVAEAHTYFVGEPAVWVHNDCFVSRRDAFRAAKRDSKIPVSRQPKKVEREPLTDRHGKPVKNESGEIVKSREYHFTNRNGEEVIIQEHSRGHPRFGENDPGAHFNIRPADNPRTGDLQGTADHYSWSPE